MSFNPEKLFSPTLTSIKPSGIRKLFDIANSMEGVVSLGIGEPDFPTPWHIRDAGIRSLEGNRTQYTSNAGMIELRKAISEYLKRRFSLEYHPEKNILVTVGGSEAIDLCMRALIVPGDEVVIPFPSFVCYAPIASLCGAKIVPIYLKAENNFKLTAQELKEAITPKTKLLVLPFPNNPTGAIMDREDLESIAAVLRNTDVAVLSDEIYAELNYTEEGHVSIAQIDGMKERTILINGFSKAYSMTGWRMGYLCAASAFVKQFVKLHQFAIMCAPTTSQYAAIEAIRYGDEDVANMRKEYNYRRRFIVDGFNKLGLTCFEPQGAFYCFPCIKSTGLTSDEFCQKILYDKKVALVPGTAFGENAEGFVRASYAYSIEHIKIALDKIKEWLSNK